MSIVLSSSIINCLNLIYCFIRPDSWFWIVLWD